jgi:hypothetical protein
MQNSCDFDRRKSTNPDQSHMLILRQSADMAGDSLNIANAFTSRDSQMKVNSLLTTGFTSQSSRRASWGKYLSPAFIAKNPVLQSTANHDLKNNLDDARRICASPVAYGN